MKIGIMGVGGIAESMGVTLREMTDATSYAVASRSLEKAEKFAEKYGFSKAYGSYEEMVKDPQVELVYIATPHSHHFENAKLCIENNKPVLCEKAFMANAKQAKEIVALAKEKNVFLAEAIWTRYMPSRKMIDEVIASGRLGEIVAISADLGYDIDEVPRITNPDLAGGALLDVGIYPLTFASMILGDDIVKITSTCTKTATGVDEQASITLEYPGKVLAHLHCSMLAATEQYGIVYGTKGYLIAKNLNNVDVIEIYSPERELQETIHAPGQINGYEYEVAASMKAISEGKIECAQAPLAQSIHMMEVMDSLRDSWGIVYPFEK